MTVRAVQSRKKREGGGVDTTQSGVGRGSKAFVFSRGGEADEG